MRRGKDSFFKLIFLKPKRNGAASQQFDFPGFKPTTTNTKNDPKKKHPRDFSRKCSYRALIKINNRYFILKFIGSLPPFKINGTIMVSFPSNPSITHGPIN